MCFYWCGWRKCMQIKPRAMSRTQNSKAKTATGLHSFTFAATSMDKSKCLEETTFAWTYKWKYAAIFENMRHFVLVPSPPMKMISFFQTFILLVYMIVFERILTHTCESLPHPPPPFGPHNHNFVVYTNCPLRFVYFNALNVNDNKVKSLSVK